MAAPLDPGAVSLSLRWASGHARAVRLRSTRPDIAVALRGRDADEAVRLLPLLYAICGAAQGVAARFALAAARGAPPADTVDAGVLAEARREHLWRVLLDWPRALGLAAHERLLVDARRRLPDADFADWARAALRAPLAQIEQALADAPAPAAPAPPRLLPALTAQATLPLWPRLEADFAAAPTYRGGPAETGAFARMDKIEAATPLCARLHARAVELVAGGVLGRGSAAAVAPGIGRAAVETARGSLLHEITLDGARIADYRVVAPTEWNFHPDGILRGWLEGAAAPTPQALHALAARAVLALDPCVPARIDVSVEE